MFNKNKTIKEITKSSIDEENYKRIDIWKAIYAGYHKEWHDIKYHTIDGVRKRKMHTLNMAKVVSEELAKMIFTEKVKVNIDNKSFNEYINKTLEDNRFYKAFQGKLEQSFALGGMVLKVHPKEIEDDKYKLSINYITPDCFIPLSWENDEVTECAFLNITKKKDKVYCLFEFHEWKKMTVTKDNGEKEVKQVYVIRNELYEGGKNEDKAKRVPLNTLYDGLQEVTPIEDLTVPLFTYIKPNLANNVDLQTPMGMSIFANSLDTLYAIDVAFDSFIREFSLGRRRIIVPHSAVRTVVDAKTGEMNRYFDASDEIYQAFNFQDAKDQKVVDNTVDIRATEHIASINSLLNLLSMQIGFSSGTFTFDGQSVKTATEVISEKSKSFQTKQSNENVLEEGLIKFIESIGEISELYDIFTRPENYKTELHWDDSIIQDRDADSDFFIKLKNSSLVSAKYCIMEILDFTETQADEMLAEITKEQQSSNPDINELLGDKTAGEFE